MNFSSPSNDHGQQLDGDAMHHLMTELFPMHRSITGDGVRESLRVLQKEIPLEIFEVESGVPVFDWTVPQEWLIRDAYIKTLDGERIVDYRHSNLHVVSYSHPVRRKMKWGELKDHVFSLPQHPEWIPYRTGYFDESWGFCVSHRQKEALEKDPHQEYEVVIDSNLAPGSLTYGEYYLPGEIADEVLISCHICHPSLANDNLSGIAVATQLAKRLQSKNRRLSYRFVFVPATIGAITWLAMNVEKVHRVKHGLVLALLGGEGSFTYTQSRSGNSIVDRAAANVLGVSLSAAGAQQNGTAEQSGSVRPFQPLGYDQRQYCSPGFDLPVGCLMRTPYGEFPEYHTSADNLSFVTPKQLSDSLDVCSRICEVLEHNRTFLNRNPYGEPQLGQRGLHRAYKHQSHPSDIHEAVMWVLNFSDGQHSLLDIAERASLSFDVVQRASELLLSHDLIEARRLNSELLLSDDRSTFNFQSEQMDAYHVN